jgi:hypothetical protein
MNTKESIVKTKLIHHEGIYEIPVIYTDRLTPKSILEIAYSPFHGSFLPYIFAGFFSDNEIQKWYFANARRHEDMRLAIKAELGRDTNYAYGQLNFSASMLLKGELLISLLISHSKLPPSAIYLLKKSIDNSLLDKHFRIAKAQW